MAKSARKPVNKGKKLPPEVLTPDEVKALLAACSSRAPTGIRNRALIVLLWRGCLRLNEALQLRPKDLDPKRGTIRVLHGKGNQARTVGLDPTAFAIVERWMDKRKAVVRGLRRTSPLVCTLEGQPVADAYVRGLMKRIAVKARITKRVHPHGLRHTCAAELAAEGVPMNVIQAQLGHKSLATTSRYLAHIAPQQLIETMRERTW